MQNSSKKTGDEGEYIARAHLVKQGYAILEANWRYKKLEVDIIAKKDKCVVFVEVKTRKSDIFGEPEVFVTKQKQNFLIAAAGQYMIQNNLDLEARFDIIAILQNNNNHTVKHLEDAFYPKLK